jgi:hypothetical protein
MDRPKGLPRTGGGSRKGKPNKLTRDVKEMILGALSAKGGQKYLERCADENMTAFLTLVGKVLPLQLAGEGGGPLVIEVARYASDFGDQAAEATGRAVVQFKAIGDAHDPAAA